MHKAMIIAMLAAVTSWGAVEFDGVDQYVNCGTDATLNPSDSDFTAMGWIKTSHSDTQFLAMKGDSGDGGGFWMLYLRDSNPYARFRVSDGSTDIYTTSYATSLLDAEWHHVCGVRSGDNVVLYVDGTLAQSVSGASGVDCTAVEPLRLGVQDHVNDIGWMQGLIDDYRQYNYALTSNQIASIIIDTCDKFVPEIKFDLLTTEDVSGNGETVDLDVDTILVQDAANWYADYDGSTEDTYIGPFIHPSTTVLSMWANMRDDTVNRYLFYRWHASAGAFLGYYTGAIADEMRFAYSPNSWGSNRRYFITDFAVPTDEWIMWTFVVDGPNERLSIYTNGVEAPCTVATSAGSINGGLINAGIRLAWDGASSYTDCQIDNVWMTHDLGATNDLPSVYSMGMSAAVTTDHIDGLVGSWPMSPAASDLIANQDPGFDPRESNTNLVAMWDSDYLPVADGQEIAEVRDYSGNGNHGTLEPSQSTGPTWTASDGERDGFLDFNGSDQHVAISDSADIKPQNCSLAAWFKTSNSSADTAVYRYRAKGYGILIRSTGAVVGMMSDGSARNAASATGFNDGDWHHAVMTYDHSYVRIYVDGELEDSLAESSDIVYSGGYAAVGRHGNYPGWYFDGGVDDVRLYHSILTTNQITALYQGTAPTNEAVLYMPFHHDDDSWHDATGNGHDATAVNNPTREAAR